MILFSLEAVKKVAFYERGKSRKNFSHPDGMKDSFDRQPPRDRPLLHPAQPNPLAR